MASREPELFAFAEDVPLMPLARGVERLQVRAALANGEMARPARLSQGSSAGSNPVGATSEVPGQRPDRRSPELGQLSAHLSER